MVSHGFKAVQDSIHRWGSARHLSAPLPSRAGAAMLNTLGSTVMRLIHELTPQDLSTIVWGDPVAMDEASSTICGCSCMVSLDNLIGLACQVECALLMRTLPVVWWASFCEFESIRMESRPMFGLSQSCTYLRTRTCWESHSSQI